MKNAACRPKIIVAHSSCCCCFGVRVELVLQERECVAFNDPVGRTEKVVGPVETNPT